jgi:hypothetical protein
MCRSFAAAPFLSASFRIILCVLFRQGYGKCSNRTRSSLQITSIKVDAVDRSINIDCYAGDFPAAQPDQHFTQLKMKLAYTEVPVRR